MKRRILCGLTISIVLLMAMLGVVKRKSYTDISQEPELLGDVHVAMLSEEFSISTCKKLAETLPNCSIILQVEAVGEAEHLFHATRQRVRVGKIYSGDSLSVGEEIYLYSTKWRMSLTVEPKSIERGFINVLKIGKKYLVFISSEIEDLYSDIPVYQLYDEALIAPVFCYENILNKPVPTEGRHTYVSYSLVEGNEFFGETENAIAAWEELKGNLLALYK